jgi:hypothetical protein
LQRAAWLASWSTRSIRSSGPAIIPSSLSAMWRVVNNKEILCALSKDGPATNLLFSSDQILKTIFYNFPHRTECKKDENFSYKLLKQL